MDPFWHGAFVGALATCAIWFVLASWWLRRERAELDDLGRRIDALAAQDADRELNLDYDHASVVEKAWRRTNSWTSQSGATRFERQYTELAPPPLTGIVQKELPPNRVSETWAEDQRRWHEFLGRVDPDRSRP